MVVLGVCNARYKVATILGGRKHLKSRHAEWRASENRIWAYLLKQKSVSFCTFREIACAGPLKYQGNVVLEHRFCTAHPLHAKCKTYALGQRFLDILEARFTLYRPGLLGTPRHPPPGEDGGASQALHTHTRRTSRCRGAPPPRTRTHGRRRNPPRALHKNHARARAARPAIRKNG